MIKFPIGASEMFARLLRPPCCCYRCWCNAPAMLLPGPVMPCNAAARPCNAAAWPCNAAAACYCLRLLLPCACYCLAPAAACAALPCFPSRLPHLLTPALAPPGPRPLPPPRAHARALASPL